MNMKQYLLIFAVLLPYMVVGQPSRKPAQGKQPSQPIRVTLKYDRPIGGYKVTAIWQPFEAKNCETGRIVVTFRHVDTGAEFQYVNTEKFSSYHTDCITFSDGFEGYKDGDCYTIEYTSPDAQSPFDGYLPFQFFDVDFDGSDEFLVLDWGGSKFGEFCVYEITNKGLIAKSYPPFDRFDCFTRLDRGKQTIRQCIVDGAWYYVEVTYRKRPNKSMQVISIPEEFELALRETLVDIANTTASDFHIVSARVKFDETEFQLSVKNNRWYRN